MNKPYEDTRRADVGGLVNKSTIHYHLFVRTQGVFVEAVKVVLKENTEVKQMNTAIGARISSFIHGCGSDNREFITVVTCNRGDFEFLHYAMPKSTKRIKFCMIIGQCTSSLDDEYDCFKTTQYGVQEAVIWN